MNKFSAILYKGAFTLVEIMTSLAIVLCLLVVLVSITDSTRKAWVYTNTKIEQFRGAQEAFEAMTRKLSQATLGTYLDYDYPQKGGKPDTMQPPKRYMRQSELRFLCGNAATLMSTAACPTHAVFFQAPIGYVSDTSHSNLGKLLNTCGYFIEYADDGQSRPEFLTTGIVPLRYRFRLMEMVEPSESLSVYKYTNSNPGYAETGWFTDPLRASPRPVQVRAENIVALIFFPKLTPEEDPSGAKLATDYSYDTTKTNADSAINPKNQLPPVVQVTMVAVDELSFKRLQPGPTKPALYKSDSFMNASAYEADMKALEKTLIDMKLNYRVFTTNVSIKGAKWSCGQKD